MTILHLSIPCVDLDAAAHFYCGVLCAQNPRLSPKKLTFNLFGLNLTCHFDPKHSIPETPLVYPYPRNFGMTLQHREDVEALWSQCKRAKIRHLSALIWHSQHPGQELTFWTADPSGEILHFRWDRDRR